ncbi:MAG TPA: hypothetical protein PLP19_20800 [bacterium]|nr:hypothetical protein [bacterium]HPN45935.1 hypothetical protein [bacterium]
MNLSGLKKIAAPAIILLLVITLSTLFHYPMHIADAVSGAPAAGFSVHNAPWRIALEPFIGWAFFYMRADQPLVEICVLMLWIMLLALPVALLTRRKKPGGWRNAVKSWLVSLPDILTITIAIIVALVFFPWPENTINNHNPDQVLVNFHSHTWYSHDGLASPQRVMQWHKRNGYQAFFLTEHNHHANTLELVERQRRAELAAEPLLLCGQEYSGSNHILLLGLTRDFITKDMPDSTAMDSAQAHNGVAVIAHWFADKRRPASYYIENGAQGFEIANQAEGIRVEDEDFHAMVDPSRERNLLMLGGADYHGYGSVAYTWNALHIPGWRQMDTESRRAAIMDILRQRDHAKITVLVYKDRESFPRRLVWLSPVFTLGGYLRSLSPIQAASWFLWMTLVWALARQRQVRRLCAGLFSSFQRFRQYLSLAGALFTGIIGVFLWWQSRPLAEYNHILREYGTYFVIYAVLAVIYGVVMIKKHVNSNRACNRIG